MLFNLRFKKTNLLYFLSFQKMLPVLVSRAKQLLPYSERLVPFASELIGVSDTLLSDENWAQLQPHLEALIEIFPLLRKHLQALVGSMDALLPHMDRLAPVMLGENFNERMCFSLT